MRDTFPTPHHHHHHHHNLSLPIVLVLTPKRTERKVVLVLHVCVA